MEKRNINDASFYRKRTRVMEELEENCLSDLREFYDGASSTSATFPWPDLGVDITPEETVAFNRYNANAGSNVLITGRLDEHEHIGNFESVDDTVEQEGAYSFINYMSLQDAIKFITVTGRLSQFITETILALFRKHGNNAQDLPKTRRTLLKPSTPVGTQIKAVGGGHLWYAGIEKVMQNYFENFTLDIEQMEIDISMDGLPLFRKSRKQLIPIQVRLVGMPQLPVLVVGTFAGPSKPDSVNDLLEPLVQEINDLHERGLSFGDKLVKFSVRAFIADAPMRAYLKATVNFNGKHGCLACTTVGASVQSGRGKTENIEWYCEDLCVK